jgi:hypothetical protein
MVSPKCLSGVFFTGKVCIISAKLNSQNKKINKNKKIDHPISHISQKSLHRFCLSTLPLWTKIKNRCSFNKKFFKKCTNESYASDKNKAQAIS